MTDKVKKKPTQKNEVEGEVKAVERGSGRDLIGAATLIFLGLVLLLNFLGVLPMSVWEWLWKFWPTLLIFYGLKLMVGEGKLGEGLTMVLVVLVYGILGMILIDKYQLSWNEIVEALKK